MSTIRAALVAGLGFLATYLVLLLITTQGWAMLIAYPVGSLLAGVDAVLNKESE